MNALQRWVKEKIINFVNSKYGGSYQEHWEERHATIKVVASVDIPHGLLEGEARNHIKYDLIKSLSNQLDEMGVVDYHSDEDINRSYAPSEIVKMSAVIEIKGIS